MPWKKQFDVERARERAQALFWAKGFEATSMDDLLECMGINRGSFYATFGSKRALYKDTLRRYDRERRRGVLEGLSKGRGPRERILGLFEGIRAEACGRNGTRGCFLTNATVELAPTDRSVSKIVRAAFEETEEFFRSAIEEGRARGEIRPGTNARETARILLGLLLGMRVLARSGAPGPVQESIVGRVKEML